MSQEALLKEILDEIKESNKILQEIKAILQRPPYISTGAHTTVQISTSSKTPGTPPPRMHEQ